MTQEEKADVIPETSPNNDNILLQNEFLSKLINTPPNLTLKYENEELNKFKDEMLSYINERNNTILTLINYFQDKINQTKEEYTSKLNLINQNYETILSSQASILNKVDKISNIELFMNKTNDQIITHEIRINNLSQDFIKAVQKYDKIYLDNLELPGYIGKFAKFKNCQAFFDFLIREIDKTNLYKEKNNLDIKNYKERLDNTIKSFNLLFKNNNEAQMKYIRQVNEKNFRECKDMNDALSNRVCDLRIENAKYSMDLIKRSEEMGKDWDKILKIKDEMLNTVNEKINGFRKIFNGNTTLFNEFRKEYEEFKLKINDILNYFKEFKNLNENDKSSNNNINNPCNNYTGCYINSNLPSEKKSFKHFSKFAKRARSKNNKNLEKKQFMKTYMTINGTKLSIDNNEINTATNNGLLHIECINKEKKNNKDTNIHSSLKKSAIISNNNNTSSNRESRSSKSVTKIEINSINKVLTSRDDLKNNINNIKSNNNEINNINNNNINNNDIQVKINEEEINNNNNTSNHNNTSEHYNKSDMNINSKMKMNNNEYNKEIMNSLENNNQEKEKEKEKEKILLKINKKSRRSFAPSSKSIISYESENNNNINDISNITSNIGTSNHKTEDLNNMMNSSLYSTNSFNINTNKFIINDNNIMQTNQQVIKEFASELEQSTNKKDMLNSNKKQIEESFKINRSKISKLNLNKTNNVMDITNSTEKTEEINNKCNNNININISGTLNKSINGNYDTVNKINKKMDIFDKKLFNLELLLKEKIIEILNQMEKLQNFFNINYNNNNSNISSNNNNLTKMLISSIKTRNHLVPLYNTNTNTNTNNNNTKEANGLNTFNINTNTTPNIILQNNETTTTYDYTNNNNANNNNNVNNNINKRNSQDDYFIGCTARRLAPIIEIDVNNLQFSPSHERTQYKIYSSKKKEGRNKWNKSGLSNNYKDINIKKNENKENFRPNYTSYTNTELNSNNNSTQIRLFGKGIGFGVNKWINLNKLITHEKSSKDNNIANINII